MEFGVHLPQIGWQDQEPAGLDRLIAVATAAERLGFGTITANDHLVYGRPWLDGPTALAAVLAAAPTARLMTSVSLPVVRGPFALAKTLGAIDMLSGGRLDAGLGPGSSEADYRLAGIPFAERWARFDEAVGAMRALWDADAPPFVGRFYDTSGAGRLLPPPAQPKGPPIWIGSWGSTAGLRRVARLGDGWLASGYNTTPDSFATSWLTLSGMLEAEGRDPSTFPSTMATTWLFVTDDDDGGASRLRASEPDAPSARSRISSAGSRSAHRRPAWTSSVGTGMPVTIISLANSPSWAARSASPSRSPDPSRRTAASR